MIEVEFTLVDKVLIGSVKCQGSEITRGDFYWEHNGYRLVSKEFPCQYASKTLCLRGTDRTEDNFQTIYQYTSKEKAEQAMHGFQAAIEAYNNSLKDKFTPHISSKYRTESYLCLLKTPFGEVCVNSFQTPDYPTGNIFLKRSDGAEIELITVTLDRKGNCINAFVFEDTTTDIHSKKATWHEKELSNAKEY